jgi:hypothetical protein
VQRLLLSFILIIWICSMGSAEDHPRKTTIKGYLVDMACVRQRSAELATIGPTHTRDCLRMAQCERSGYAVLTDDQKILRFDLVGNQKAKKLILSSNRDRNFRISVTGIVLGDEIQVAKLEMQ